VLGRTIGLGWSQANANVLTRTPAPTSADLAGFPVMHFTDPINCMPITLCYPNPTVPAMDDIDVLTRLYPGSPQTAGRIYGSVYFTDASGNQAQPMQGVNVVARLIVSGQPSRQYVATSVSGFLFCGNAGNIVDGYLDATGLPYNRWGSNNPALEGYYDLSNLTIPTGQTSAQYQLSVEALDPNWSLGVEPYAPTQVAPSGAFAPGMPRSGLCRVGAGSSPWDRRISDFSNEAGRHNQRLSRNVSNGSAGRKRSGMRPDGLAWARARSLSCMSACR